MGGGWIAGSVRARLLVAERRAGADAIAEVAASPTLRAALGVLAHTPYRRGIRLALGLAEAERVVVEKTLLDLRLLLGWLPPDAHGLLRTLAAWFELANAEDRLAYLAGGQLRRPFELGGLSVAWARATETQSAEELRRALSGPAWTELEAGAADDLGLPLRLAWARRVATEVPEARRWALGAAALLLASERFVARVPADRLVAPPISLLGGRWQGAGTLEELAAALPPDAAWALAGVDAGEDLWQAETRWWEEVARDAEALLHSGVAGQAVVTGAVALLAVDAHGMVAALEQAARNEVGRAAA